MKQLFTLCAMLALTTGAMADDISYILDADGNEATTDIESVGAYETADDGTVTYTSGWWSAFSSYYVVPAGYTVTIDYTGYNNGEVSSNNWGTALILSNDVNRYGDGYSEYVGITVADSLWIGNSDDHFSTGYPSSYEERVELLNGASVKVKIANCTTKAVITIEATSEDGTVMAQRMNYTTFTDGETVRAFFIVEENYMEGVTSSIAEGADTSFSGDYPYIAGGEEETSVGAEDFSTGWWGDFSSYYLVPSGYKLDLSFLNACSETAEPGEENNYSNLVAVMVVNDISQSDRYSVSDYAEYVGLTTAGWEWCNYNSRDYSSDIELSGTELAAALNGATVDITVTNDDTDLSVEMVATAEDGTVMTQEVFTTIEAQDVRSFLIPAGCYISNISSTLTSLSEGDDDSTDDSLTGIAAVETADEEGDATIYNLQGQKVDESYKGIVIKNGKKYFAK